MEHRFYISGMTCLGCQKAVTEKINTLEEVSAVEVSLETGIAQIRSVTKLSVNKISALLGAKYSVQEDTPITTRGMKTFKLKELFPLFLIFAYLIAGTLFLTSLLQVRPQRAMQIFMGLFFIVFSFFKFLDYRGFPDSFSRYDPLAKKIPGYAKIYPFIETALGAAFLLEWQVPIALVLTIVILSFTTYGVLRSLRQKDQIECACLGTALKLPMTEATLIENGIMLLMACILLMGYVS